MKSGFVILWLLNQEPRNSLNALSIKIITSAPSPWLLSEVNISATHMTSIQYMIHFLTCIFKFITDWISSNIALCKSNALFRALIYSRVISLQIFINIADGPLTILHIYSQHFYHDLYWHLFAIKHVEHPNWTLILFDLLLQVRLIGLKPAFDLILNHMNLLRALFLSFLLFICCSRLKL